MLRAQKHLSQAADDYLELSFVEVEGVDGELVRVEDVVQVDGRVAVRPWRR